MALQKKHKYSMTPHLGLRESCLAKSSYGALGMPPLALSPGACRHLLLRNNEKRSKAPQLQEEEGLGLSGLQRNLGGRT